MNALATPVPLTVPSATGVPAPRRAFAASAAMTLLLAVIAVDNPQENPGAGRWQSPLYGLGTLLFENLNKATGIAALRISLLDLAIVALCLAAWRRQPAGAAGCLVLRDLSVLAALTLLASEVLGMARGGDFRNSLWQLRQPLAAPLLTLVFARVLDVRRDRIQLGAAVLSAAALKVVLGLYVYEGIFRPLNERPPYTTSHSDSVLFTVAVVLTVSLAAARRTAGVLVVAIALVPALGIALLTNNRRLAWVEVGASALLLVGLLPWGRTKRKLVRLMMVSLPICALYAAAGWSSPSRLFLPVHVVRSLASSSDDRSTASRDIENYNLIQTLKANPLLGSGLGHEYRAVSRVDDISRAFPQWRFIPHNSVLGLWAFAGMLGFSLVWLPNVSGLYLAARSFRLASRPLDQATAAAAVAALVAYTLQCWGDMGAQSWTGTFLVALAMAMASQLAVAVGAWPTTDRGPR